MSTFNEADLSDIFINANAVELSTRRSLLAIPNEDVSRGNLTHLLFLIWLARMEHVTKRGWIILQYDWPSENVFWQLQWPCCDRIVYHYDFSTFPCADARFYLDALKLEILELQTGNWKSEILKSVHLRFRIWTLWSIKTWNLKPVVHNLKVNT